MKCENCNNEHSGTYGSGRFCTTKCARGFSTKNKRVEINNKVSAKMTGRKLTEEHKKNLESANNHNRKEKITKKCVECGVEIQCRITNTRKFCGCFTKKFQRDRNFAIYNRGYPKNYPSI